jgi:hypothetical protein
MKQIRECFFPSLGALEQALAAGLKPRPFKAMDV